jgi:hypothetical protein
VQPSPESGVIEAPVSGSVELRLNDAKRADDWVEGNYQTPGADDSVTAMALALNGCGSDSGEIEFRFANQDGRLAFAVAQDLNSDRSDVVLEFAVVANGRTVDTRQIAFDQSATLEAPLTGVSAVILEVDHVSGGRGCDGATALITSASVEGP